MIICIMLCGCSKSEPQTAPTTAPTSEPTKELTKAPVETSTTDETVSKTLEELNQEIQDEIKKTNSDTEILNYDTLYAAANIAIADTDIYLELRSATDSGYIIIDTDGVKYENVIDNFIKTFELTVGKDALDKINSSTKLIIEIAPGAYVKRLQPPVKAS